MLWGVWIVSQERGGCEESNGGGGVMSWPAVMVVAGWPAAATREGREMSEKG